MSTAASGNWIRRTDARHRGRVELVGLVGGELRSVCTIEDGADSLIIRRTTHAPPRDVNAGHERFTWATICREVGKLRVGILGGEVLPLATGFATAELNAAKHWRKVATPTGIGAHWNAKS